MSAATWYVLDDGSAADPADIVTGNDGKLASKDGRKVAYREDGVTPRSRGVDPDAERAKKAAPPPKVDPKAPATVTRDLKADTPKGGYKTRESKAD